MSYCRLKEIGDGTEPSVKLDWILNENKRYKINLGVTKELYGFVLGDIIELMFIFLGVLVVL